MYTSGNHFLRGLDRAGFWMLVVCVLFTWMGPVAALTGSGVSDIVPLETVSPTLESAAAVTDNSVAATFSEALLAPDATAVGHYAVSGPGIGTLLQTPSTVTGSGTYILTWDAGEMRDAVTLTLTASGVQDAVGNPLAPAANTASFTGMGTAPVFSDLQVTPAKASTGETVSIAFTASESLGGDPEVTVNGHPASEATGKAEGFVFEYEVLEEEPLGMAALELSGADLAGNLGTLSDNSLLEIVEAPPGLPLYGWPLAALLLLSVSVFILMRKRFDHACECLSADLLSETDATSPREFQNVEAPSQALCNAAREKMGLFPPRTSKSLNRSLHRDTLSGLKKTNSARGGNCPAFFGPDADARKKFGTASGAVQSLVHWLKRLRAPEAVPFFALLYVVHALACSFAFADAPVVSNVAMTQLPTATSTQVDIYYDLDAPNGPCDITVSLSKEGGTDGYPYPVTSVTGDLSGVTTGTGHHLVWDIRADYPEEDLPQARVLVTADDGLIAPEVTLFDINGGAASTADLEVTLDNSVTGSPTEYMASEASDFSGASWEPYDTAPYFTLSSGEGGTKTVYFKVRNAAGESAPVSDAIHLIQEQTILLPGGVPLELVWIPSGSFLMGRYPGEADSSSREDPQHLVTLAYGFWMGKYEVTQQQWIAVRGSWPVTAPSELYGLGNTYPAYWISWNATRDFITSLNAPIVSSGQGPLTVRLPSEAEWEYACRAGTQTRFYFGESLGCAGDCSDCAAGVLPGNRSDYMWYCGNFSLPRTKPVGGKLPNAFGLYDISGNVGEWCEDHWNGSYTGAPADGSAWISSPGADRMYRGGSWGSYAQSCRSAYRGHSQPSYLDYIGFRLAAVE